MSTRRIRLAGVARNESGTLVATTPFVPLNVEHSTLRSRKLQNYGRTRARPSQIGYDACFIARPSSTDLHSIRSQVDEGREENEAKGQNSQQQDDGYDLPRACPHLSETVVQLETAHTADPKRSSSSILCRLSQGG